MEADLVWALDVHRLILKNALVHIDLSFIWIVALGKVDLLLPNVSIDLLTLLRSH